MQMCPARIWLPKYRALTICNCYVRNEMTTLVTKNNNNINNDNIEIKSCFSD